MKFFLAAILILHGIIMYLKTKNTLSRMENNNFRYVHLALAKRNNFT